MASSGSAPRNRSKARAYSSLRDNSRRRAAGRPVSRLEGDPKKSSAPWGRGRLKGGSRCETCNSQLCCRQFMGLNEPDQNCLMLPVTGSVVALRPLPARSVTVDDGVQVTMLLLFPSWPVLVASLTVPKLMVTTVLPAVVTALMEEAVPDAPKVTLPVK